MRVALTVAGSDSGGGAGIQADLKTFQRFGVFGTSVITAITAQNTVGVRAWSAVDPSLVRAQLEAVLEDLPPAAMKSGMLANAGVVDAVAATLRAAGSRIPYILDPVLVATSGDSLHDPDAVRAIRESLLSFATLTTPNIPEAQALTGTSIRDEEGMARAAELLATQFGVGAALVTGGHASGPTISDVLWNGAVRVYHHDRLDSASTHGTGCTLSAAITANVALGFPLPQAVELALDYVHRAIATAPGLGRGQGPLNHLA